MPGKKTLNILFLLCFSIEIACSNTQKGVEKKEKKGSSTTTSPQNHPNTNFPANQSYSKTGLKIGENFQREVQNEKGVIVSLILLPDSREENKNKFLEIEFPASRSLPLDDGGKLVVSDSVVLNGDEIEDGFVIVEIPVKNIVLPGGVNLLNISSLIESGEKRMEVPAFFDKKEKRFVCVIPARQAGLKLIADPHYRTPEMEKMEGIVALTALMTIKNGIEDALSISLGKNRSQDTEELEDKQTLYYVGNPVETISLDSTIYGLVRLKGLQKKGSQENRFAVVDKTGKPVKNKSTLLKVLEAWKLKLLFADKKTEEILKLTAEMKGNLISAEESMCIQSEIECLKGFSLRILLEEAENAIVNCMDKNRCDGLSDGLKKFLLISSSLTLIESQLTEKNSPDIIRGNLKTGEILNSLFNKKRKKNDVHFNYPLEGEEEAIKDVLKKVSKNSSGIGSKLGADEKFLSQVISNTDWLKVFSEARKSFCLLADCEEIEKMAAFLSSAKIEKAPAPETRISKFNFKGNQLTIVFSGSDSDGRVTGYKYWIDDPKVPRIIKGSSTVRVDLKGFSGGLHTLFASAIDEDGQIDETPTKFPFFLKKVVNVSISQVRSSFKSSANNINSEHHRSAYMYAKEIEGEVTGCAQENFRFGIDGKGSIKVQANFSGGGIASQATGRKVIATSFRNKPLTDCILKAMRSGKLRYNQPLRPQAEVQITFDFEPSTLFFEGKNIADAPGKDLISAYIFNKCMEKAREKTERFCLDAVRNLPVPGEKTPEGTLEEEKKQDENAGSEALKDLNETETSDKKTENDDKNDKDEEIVKKHEKKKDEKENLKEKEKGKSYGRVEKFEFDPFEIENDCIQHSVKYLISKCSSWGSQKKEWCIDSCLKLTNGCEKKCKGKSEFDTDKNQCKKDCWLLFMIECSTNCMLKNTPFEEKEN